MELSTWSLVWRCAPVPKCRVAEPDSRIPPQPTRVEVGLGGTTGTGQTNDHARSKNSSLALCPPFTQNRCHFGRGDSNKIFPPLQEQSCRSDPYSMHILKAPGDEMLLTKHVQILTRLVYVTRFNQFNNCKSTAPGESKCSIQFRFMDTLTETLS